MRLAFWRKAEPPPSLADAYKRAERAIKDIEIIGAILQDTPDWEKMSDEAYDLSAKNLTEFFKKTHFGICCFRDELILTLERMPNVKLRRKRRANPQGEPSSQYGIG